MIEPRLVIFSLDRLADPRWLAILSEAEHGYGNNFEGIRRTRFLNARIALRATAADLLDCPPEQINIERDALGQLSIDAPLKLFVSITYGDHIGLVVLATTRVGVDYESGPAPVFWQSAMRRYLCRCEQNWLEGLDDSMQESGFVWLWTRREACLKYLGTGIRGSCVCLCDLSINGRLVHLSFSLLGGIGALASEGPLRGLQTHYLSFNEEEFCPAATLLWRKMPDIDAWSHPITA